MKLWNRKPPGEYMRMDIIAEDGSVVPVRALREGTRAFVVYPFPRTCVVTSFRIPGLELYYQDQPIAPVTVPLTHSRPVCRGDALHLTLTDDGTQRDFSWERIFEMTGLRG